MCLDRPKAKEREQSTIIKHRPQRGTCGCPNLCVACIQKMSFNCATIQMYSYYDYNNEHDNFSAPAYIPETGSKMNRVVFAGLKNKKLSHMY